MYSNFPPLCLPPGPDSSYKRIISLLIIVTLYLNLSCMMVLGTSFDWRDEVHGECDKKIISGSTTAAMWENTEDAFLNHQRWALDKARRMWLGRARNQVRWTWNMRSSLKSWRWFLVENPPVIFDDHFHRLFLIHPPTIFHRRHLPLTIANYTIMLHMKFSHGPLKRSFLNYNDRPSFRCLWYATLLCLKRGGTKKAIETAEISWGRTRTAAMMAGSLK